MTLHDFNHVSGGCHYPGPCTQLAAGCLACPQVDRTRASAAGVARNRRLRAQMLARDNVTIVAPSHYVRDRVVDAGIIPKERAKVLRNPYRPLAEPRPGWTSEIHVLLIADHLAERRKNVALALDGVVAWAAARPAGGAAVVVDLVGAEDAEIVSRLADAGIPAVRHGRIDDHGRLASVLRRSDILLTASTEDNWPNVLVEAGAYGAVPVVGPGHGCAEFVAAYDVGAVAREYTADAFAQALARAAAVDPAARRDLAAAVRADHDPARIAMRFRDAFVRAPAATHPHPQGQHAAAHSLALGSR